MIEGWHGDGNFARTSLMYALWKTQGVTVQPWRPYVRLGAAREGESVYLSLNADQPWEGRLVFDRPRHKVVMRLPFDYPRINQFPEWFTVGVEARYEVRSGADRPNVVSGEDMAKGVPVKLRAGETLLLEARKL